MQATSIVPQGWVRIQVWESERAREKGREKRKSKREGDRASKESEFAKPSHLVSREDCGSRESFCLGDVDGCVFGDQGVEDADDRRRKTALREGAIALHEKNNVVGSDEAVEFLLEFWC